MKASENNWFNILVNVITWEILKRFSGGVHTLNRMLKVFVFSLYFAIHNYNRLNPESDDLGG